MVRFPEPSVPGAPRHVLHTGLRQCFDSAGNVIPCQGAFQDAAAHNGIPWPEPRFEPLGEHLVHDLLTGLIWERSTNALGFALTWREALEHVADLNAVSHADRSDWRLPNRRELRSLIAPGERKPALPQGHPFRDVFLGWYWSSTTAAIAPAYAWYVHTEGGRMFYGAKTGYCLVWPVCGESPVLPRTGQEFCYDSHGALQDCTGSLQDGALQCGVPWPEPRFELQDKSVVLDRLTNLLWQQSPAAAGQWLTWQQALEAAARVRGATGRPWRLPSINELESLVDASRHSPALPEGAPFSGLGQAFWSATSSGFEPDWSFCLYLHKGAVGVGHKPKAEFQAWLVCSGA